MKRIHRGFEAPMDLDKKNEDFFFASVQVTNEISNVFQQKQQESSKEMELDNLHTDSQDHDHKLQEHEQEYHNNYSRFIDYNQDENKSENVETKVDKVDKLEGNDIHIINNNHNNHNKNFTDNIEWISKYLSIPFVVMLFILGLVYNDYLIKYSHLISNRLIEQESCSQQYTINKCMPGLRVPALDQQCKQWESCMHTPLRISRWRVLAECVADVVEGFVGNISYKSIAFILALLYIFHFYFMFPFDKSAASLKHNKNNKNNSNSDKNDKNDKSWKSLKSRKVKKDSKRIG